LHIRRDLLKYIATEISENDRHAPVSVIAGQQNIQIAVRIVISPSYRTTCQLPQSSAYRDKAASAVISIYAGEYRIATVSASYNDVKITIIIGIAPFGVT
jgi:hypothetical protein